MPQTYQVEPSDPWYIDPADTLQVLTFIRHHVRLSVACTHGREFTYDFCPIANGTLDAAIEHLTPPQPSGEDLTRCQGCGTIRPEAELNEFVFDTERVAPGEPLPIGECPDCGAVCHPYPTKAAKP